MKTKINGKINKKEKTNDITLNNLFENKKHVGPRHTPNPSPLRNFCVQKITNKKLMFFSEKLC